MALSVVVGKCCQRIQKTGIFYVCFILVESHFLLKQCVGFGAPRVSLHVWNSAPYQLQTWSCPNDPNRDMR